MLTLALDEYGDFEGLKTEAGPVYIAGLIYDDKNISGEERLERSRIKAYYKAVVSEAAEKAVMLAGEFTYPEALHSNGDGVRDHYVVRPVKELVRLTLPEFIRRGTYRGRKLTWLNPQGVIKDFQPRQGEYHIFVILKSDEGIKKLLAGNANILAKDDYASNLYFHMADEMICRLIFYNPVIRDVKDISLDIATRSSGDMMRNDPLAQEYMRQGYKPIELDDPGKVRFNLTNADIYRSVIAEEILDAQRPDICISGFNVNSIQYTAGARKMEFLHMADTICSFLQFEIEGAGAEEWLESIAGRTKDLTGRDDNLIFGYDEIDIIYARAWNKYLEGDLYKALSIAYDAGKYEGAFAAFYRDLWFKKLEARVLEHRDVADFNMAVRKLFETLNNNSLNSDKALYILKILEEMAPEIEKEFRSPEARGILYLLNDIGVTVYCHIGDSINAEKYFQKCTELAGTVSLESYLGTRNKMVVFCCDYFAMDQAEEIADENIVYQELLTDLKKDVHLPGTAEEGNTSLGKARSQRGQVYAFKRDPRAAAELRAALADFEEGSANYKITQSYLLHHYLDTGNREAYLSEAEKYFDGRKKPAEQLKYIVDEGAKYDSLINMSYALYVFLKSLYLFRLDELSERVWKDLNSLEKRFARKIAKPGWKLSGHPAELIFKYMRLIAISRNEAESEQVYTERLAGCLPYHGATEDAIRMFAEAETAEKKGETELRDELTERLCQFLKDSFEAFKELEIPRDGEARYKQLGERITFMYR